MAVVARARDELRDLGIQHPTHIYGPLWQGPAPMPGDTIRQHVVVLCAQEYQPTRLLVSPGSVVPELVHAPFDDGSIDKGLIGQAKRAALTVAHRAAMGKKVLVTCMQGRNRSGLVTALALRLMYNLDGSTAASLVRSRRAHTLTNDEFLQYLQKLGKPNQMR